MRQYSPENPENTSPADLPEGEGNSSGQSGEQGEHPHGKRRRRKIKIRKRIRIRKKPSPKKKVKKLAETIAWIAVIIGFIVTLIVMVRELDIKDERLKQSQKQKKAPGKR
ncbi:MAG TPA: hypothetical protein VFW78_10240 [Bacteroidia bacterium]|nr:hypothetical protein [Bacteroidia bacterium]